MGRKSRKNCLIKPFCYFCGREFDNEKVLVQHQKAKHFKCTECNRKLETANGLLVHMQQVHKMVQRRVPNALEGRDNISSSIQGMNGVPSEVIEEHRMQHMQKLANLKRQKQQRISWTQINAPGFNNQATTMAQNTALHTNVLSNMPPGMGGMGAMSGSNLDGDMTNNFGNTGLNGAGAMAGGLLANPLAANMTNGMGATMTSSMGVPLGTSNISGSIPSGMATGMTSAAPDADGKNKLLILDANGMPISRPAQSSQQTVQPTVLQPLKQSSFLPSNKIVYKSNFSGPTTSHTTPSNLNMDATHTGVRSTGFDRPSSGFDRPTSGFDRSTYGLERPSSGFDKPSSGFSTGASSFSTADSSGFYTGPSSFSTVDTGLSGAPSSAADHADSKPVETEDDNSFHITFYKATGLQPLYVPTPSLENTKLSYASDTVSIEELRAKIKYNWHETQT